MKNNNSEIIHFLAGKLYTSNRRRNRILTWAAAVCFFLLFSIFSIVAGRLDAEELRFIRMSGTSATTFLEYATPEQEEQILRLDYIRDTGMQYSFGDIRKGQEKLGLRAYVSNQTFNAMFEPAYTQIHGKYPVEKNEIMLARRTLEGMGIKKPEVGMDIAIDNKKGEKEFFTLSGFYTEFMSEETLPYGFFSESYFQSLKDSEKQYCVLAICQKDWYSGENIEDLLYKDIKTVDKAQQFIGGNSVNYAAVLELTGGPDIGLCCAILIILCAGMLIYNVTALSLHREIRQYGLLKTIGATSIQIHRIVWRQITKTLLCGLIAGMIFGGIFVLGVLPKILEGKYLEGFGEASAILSFHPLLFWGAVFFTFAVVLLSSFAPIRKLGKMAPVNALYYLNGIVCTGRKRKNSSKGNQISVMAWRNIFRNRKNACITLGSLMLGFTIALGAMMIICGIDYSNSIKQRDDFRLQTGSAPFLSDGYVEPNTYFAPSFIKKIKELDGIEQMQCCVGGYLALDSTDAVWQPLLMGSRVVRETYKSEEDKKYAEHVRKFYMAAFTVVEQPFIDALTECNEKYHLSLDIAGLKKGTGAIAFHFNELSRQLEKESLSCIGKSFSLKTFAGESLSSLKFGGYLKRSQKGLPECSTEASTSGYPTLLISRKGFERLNIEEKIFAININVSEKKEPVIKYRLNQMVEELVKTQQDNLQEGVVGLGYSLYAKSDELASAEADLLPFRILMYTVSALLACMGVFNYFSITASSLEIRRKEFAVIRSIGMTGKQLRHMLILEGVYYSSLITAFLLTAGSVIMRLLYYFVKERVPYMQFYYPAAGLIAILAVTYAGCICLPLWMVHRGIRPPAKRRRNGN